MARRRGRGHRRGGFKLPVISLAILGGQAAAAIGEGGAGNIMGSLHAFQSYYTGVNFVNRSFEPQRLLLGYGPWVVKRFVGAFARVRMPVKGLPISLS